MDNFEQKWDVTIKTFSLQLYRTELQHIGSKTKSWPWHLESLWPSLDSGVFWISSLHRVLKMCMVYHGLYGEVIQFLFFQRHSMNNILNYRNIFITCKTTFGLMRLIIFLQILQNYKLTLLLKNSIVYNLKPKLASFI